MNVITFNLRCADDPNGHSVAERAPRLKQILDRYDADLMGFQEVTPRWLEILRKDYSDRYEMHYLFRDRSDWREAEPLLWKKELFTLLDSGSFWFSDTPDIMSPGWDSIGCHRICSWVKLKENQSGKEFVWFNLHYGFSDPCQMASTKLLLEHVKVMAPNAVIVTGDFNMRPDFPAYKLMTQTLADANVLTANDPGTTYHGYAPAGKNEHIDYCFVSPDTAVPLDSRVITDTVDGKYPSDHFGVITALALKSRETLLSLKVGETPSPQTDAVSRSRRLRERILNNQASLVLLQELPEEFLPRMEILPGYGGYEFVRSERRFFAAWKNGYSLKHHAVLESVAGEAAALTRLARGQDTLTLIQGDLSSCRDPLAAVKALCAHAEEQGEAAVIALSGLAVGSEAYRFLRAKAADARTAKGVDTTPTYHGFLDPDAAPAVEDHLFLLGAELTSYAVDTHRPKGTVIAERDPILVKFTC